MFDADHRRAAQRAERRSRPRAARGGALGMALHAPPPDEPGSARSCRGTSRWRTGRPTSSSRCRAASRGTSCGSSASTASVTRSRRSPSSSPRREYGCCATSSGSTCRRRGRSRSSPAATTPTARPLEPALVTRHLQFSLPYRALFSTTLRPDTANRLLDALALLLVRLHLAGFSWGDCSLSNTLFRRDAGAFAAYLVDAETGELHERLSRRASASTTSRSRGPTSPASCCDLEAGGLLHESIDPSYTADAVVDRYQRAVGRAHRAARVRRRRALAHRRADPPAQRPRLRRRRARRSSTDADGSTVRIQPKVVDAGHHSRRLLRLTGLDVRGEPGPPAAQRPRRLPRGARPAGRATRRSSRTAG